MRLQILDLAREDLIEGFHFYEDKEKGLGDYFLVNLYSDIESLKVFGGIHRMAYLGFHRALAKRFPFAIYHTVEADFVRIRSVVDCRKKPLWIRQHLRCVQQFARPNSRDRLGLVIVGNSVGFWAVRRALSRLWVSSPLRGSGKRFLDFFHLSFDGAFSDFDFAKKCDQRAS